MSRYYRFCCVLVLAYISKVNAGTLGRTPDLNNGPKQYYQNNPFLNSNSSFLAEQYRHAHSHGYHGNHGHHHHHDFYHNPNETPNSADFSPEYNPNNDFPENYFNKQSSEGPKITMRREVADETVPNYPYEKIKKYLDDHPLLKQYFAEVPQIGNRDGATDDEDLGEHLCKMQTIRTYYPKKLKNINNIEKIIVNDENDYKQALQHTKCINAGAQCDIPFDAFGYTSTCHQNYDNKRLMVYETGSEKIVFDEFKVPSCCVCIVKKVKK